MSFPEAEVEKNLVSHAVSRAERDPLFVGHALYRYAVSEKIKGKEVLSRLGLSIEGYRKLALCLAPVPGSKSFPLSVREIAMYSACSQEALEKILEEFGPQGANRSGDIP